MHCATDAKDKAKETGTVLKLFQKYLGNSVLPVYIFILILFHYFFVIPVVPQTTQIKLTDH
jgi:hypothetical protein